MGEREGRNRPKGKTTRSRTASASPSSSSSYLHPLSVESPLNRPHLDNNDRLNNIEEAIRLLETRLGQLETVVFETVEELLKKNRELERLNLELARRMEP